LLTTFQANGKETQELLVQTQKISWFLKQDAGFATSKPRFFND
jgi:hypothetical protein